MLEMLELARVEIEQNVLRESFWDMFWLVSFLVLTCIRGKKRYVVFEVFLMHLMSVYLYNRNCGSFI